MVVWLTGLSGSGKTTLATYVTGQLKDKGLRVEHLDGDAIRAVFPETSFTRTDRDRHIKYAGYVASMLEKHGVVVVASFISPYAEARAAVRGMCKDFTEVYLATRLEVCEQRDPKGLYLRARAGEIKNFTGIDDPFEVPANPEFTFDTEKTSREEIGQALVKHVLSRVPTGSGGEAFV
ncbi:MAG: adenylyl-sulfate kinase [Bacteriovoracia bacterium]